MDRRLPPQYAGWQDCEPELRRMTTPELIAEIQDGPPERRLAALSVIDLSEVEPAIIEDWIRNLPDTEANELAGAIPAQRPQASCDDELRWVDVARMGYERRHLPPFLVMLFSSLEALEAKHCDTAGRAWESIGEWLIRVYDDRADAGDEDALGDISLFVFENYLDRAPVFDAFCTLLESHLPLAEDVSTNPSFLLGSLQDDAQRRALKAADEAGGLPFADSWALLNDF